MIPQRLAIGLGLSLLWLFGCGHDGSSSPSSAIEESDSPPQPSFLAQQARSEIATKRPRYIILILIDTLRSDHLGVYGDRRGLTPNMDLMAKHGILFTNAIATSSWTRPSVASIFTSRYPRAINLGKRTHLLSESQLTLAECLSLYGGFSCYGVFSNAQSSAENGFAQGFQSFTHPELIPSAENVSKDGLNFLRRHEAENPGAPAFLFLHYLDPHDPYVPHPEIYDESEQKGRFSGSREDLDVMDKLPWNDVSEEDRDRIRHLYAGEVKFTDHWIGQFLLGLRFFDENLEETLIITVADHGEGLWDHELRGHGQDLYDEQIRVPLILRLPGMGEADSQVIGSTVSLIDLAPTILDACHLARPACFQGFSLFPLMGGADRDPAFDYAYSDLTLDERDQEVLRTPTQKIIRNKTEIGRTVLELYDLHMDPREKIDLANTEQHRDQKEFLAETLTLWSESIQATNTGGETRTFAEMSPHMLRDLRALGYITEKEFDEAMLEQKEQETPKETDSEGG